MQPAAAAASAAAARAGARTRTPAPCSPGSAPWSSAARRWGRAPPCPSHAWPRPRRFARAEPPARRPPPALLLTAAAGRHSRRRAPPPALLPYYLVGAAARDWGPSGRAHAGPLHAGPAAAAGVPRGHGALADRDRRGGARPGHQRPAVRGQHDAAGPLRGLHPPRGPRGRAPAAFLRFRPGGLRWACGSHCMGLGTGARGCGRGQGGWLPGADAAPP